MLKNINNVRLWHKADIRRVPVHVRFWVNSGHHSDPTECPLLTQSGHQELSRRAVPSTPICVSRDGWIRLMLLRDQRNKRPDLVFDGNRDDGGAVSTPRPLASHVKTP
jgi:hypothetical protein